MKFAVHLEEFSGKQTVSVWKAAALKEYETYQNTPSDGLQNIGFPRDLCPPLLSGGQECNVGLRLDRFVPALDLGYGAV